jgi:hypothetical protein
MHILNDFDNRLISGLLKESLLIIATNLAIMGWKTAEKNIA